MTYRILAVTFVFLGACVLLFARWSPAQQPEALNAKAPEMVGIQEWVNSKPLKLADLKGKVVVLHFWTFG